MILRKKLAKGALFAALILSLQMVVHAGTSFTDNFSSYPQNSCFTDGTNFGPWTEVFGDYSPSNCVQVQSNGSQTWLDENPAVATSSGESHSSLVAGPSFTNPLTFSVSAATVAQLRQGSQPNPWEVAWVLWHYQDNTHFYYFIAKTNGWELGKEDPAYPGNQRFLATGSSPTFPIGQQYNIQIVETTQNTITVYVGGQPITTFTDTERPYTSGRIALYTEESHAQFQNVSASTTNATTVSASGPEWASAPFGTAQTGNFTAEMDATPLATTIDGGIGLSNGPQSAFTGLACIGRFNNSGTIDARNGGSYTAVNSIPYSANQTYHFRFVVSLSSHTYSLYVTPPGQSEQTVALNYAFRTEQQSVAALNSWSVFADIFSMQVANFLAPSATAIANSTWANSSFATQSSTFEADWDAMPTASGMDGVMALSNGPQTDFPQFACLVRFFSSTGTIQARNGGNYASDITISYVPNLMYHFRLLVNVSNHTYSVYVTPGGGNEQLLAANYAFRTEQANVTALNNVGIIVDTTTGSLRFGNFAITASASSPSSTYDQTVLADSPVAFWNINGTGSSESDLTGNGNKGTYFGGTLSTSTMPNGDQVNVFNGSSQYLSIPSNPSFSITTTRYLTWEMWIQPAVLQFPNDDTQTHEYVSAMGKCAQVNPPTCEWEARMYDLNNAESRPNRLSAYVFNLGGGEGAGADWQPDSGVIQAGQWLHVVGEYTTDPSLTPSNCPNQQTYPGAINIWVNGVLWNQIDHNPTGCMSQPPNILVTPQAAGSPLNIGTMNTNNWFEGAIGKVAIYNYLLTQTQINNHYQTMTGTQPTGSCGNTCSF